MCSPCKTKSHVSFLQLEDYDTICKLSLVGLQDSECVVSPDV